MKYIFPVSFMANTFAMTAVMVVLSFAGRSDTAADIGIVHGVTVALFYAFSANARSLILNPSSGVSTKTILGSRLLLLLPVGVASFLLSTQLAGVEILLAIVLVVRRCAEWIAEIAVSEMELRNKEKPAVRFLLTQVVLTASVILWLLGDFPALLLALLVWGTSPLWFCSHILLGWADLGSLAERTWLTQLPHFGSTAVIGVSVYVFRIFLLLLVGKTLAGDLYTVFAVGGLIGTVFAQAIGPTLVQQHILGSARRLPVWLMIVVGLSLLAGTGLCGLISIWPDQLLWTGKSGVFWMGMGFSLLGGGVMVAAQLVRLGLLQRHTDKDVFGPDVVANIVIVASVPFTYYILGVDALGSLYLISSVLSFICYYSAARSADLWTSTLHSWAEPLRVIIVTLLFVPIFFQLSGEIFHDPGNYFTADGTLSRLPIPLSVLACYGGIILLGGFERAHMTLSVIFFTFILMLASSILLAYEPTGQAKAKLILLIQFILPMFALVLGQMFDKTNNTISVIARVFLCVLAVIVPIQLVATWGRGQIVLSPYLHLFSVYQHFQYVPVIFSAAYLVALFSLWDVRWCRLLLLTLCVPAGIFMAASLSILATAGLVMGVLGFSAHRRFRDREMLILCVGIGISVLGYFTIVSTTNAVAKYEMEPIEGVELAGRVELPRHMGTRITYWKFYGKEVFSSGTSLLLGHSSSPNKTQYPSAHNYYLDFVYNFGLIALLPLVGLIIATMVMICRSWEDIVVSPPLLGLVCAVLFLLFVDNFFKVGMRQPYPGIITFFLWGILLARLSRVQRTLYNQGAL
jgi:hypothetical protein